MISRNDPCPCGSGKKYKKCCLNKDAAKRAALISSIADLFKPGALCVVGDSHVPAIACENAATKEFLFVVARASRQMDPLEAAEEADADLASSPGAASGEVGPNCLSYLHKIGYQIMAGVTVEEVQLLENLIEDEDFDEDPADQAIEALYDVVEQQIRDEDPPEVRQTLVRLRRAGYSRGDILHMIVHVLLHETEQAATDDGQPDLQRYAAALAQLPEFSCGVGAELDVSEIG